MDLLNAAPEHGLFFLATLVAVIVLIACGAIGAWRFRGQMANAKIEELRAQVDAWKTQVEMEKTRRVLANDQQWRLTEILLAVNAELETLKAQQAAGVAVAKLASTTASISIRILELFAANAALSRTITGGGDPAVGPTVAVQHAMVVGEVSPSPSPNSSWAAATAWSAPSCARRMP